MSEPTDSQKRSVEPDTSRDRQQIELMAGMADSIAHDFSNSVGIIAGHAASIADHLIPNTRAHEEALAILDATKQARGLIKRLLSFARSGRGSREQLIEPVALHAVVEDAIAIARDAFAGDRVEFTVKSLQTVPQVEVDSGQFLELLLNLFRNAVDAMPAGGLITIDASQSTVNKADYVILRIRDNGVGMSPEVRQRIFEPFFSTKSERTGLGLGLTVVRSVVESWGGLLKVRSSPGHGSSFRMFLRRVAAPPAELLPAITPPEAHTILVIDDDATCLEEIEMILKGEGYETITARGGEEGLNLFAKHAARIDLLVIDVVMPGKDGKQVLSAILEADPAAQIILTSGFSRDYVRTYMESGAWGFIQKPVETQRLVGTVRKMLGQFRTPVPGQT